MFGQRIHHFDPARSRDYCFIFDSYDFPLVFNLTGRIESKRGFNHRSG